MQLQIIGASNKKSSIKHRKSETFLSRYVKPKPILFVLCFLLAYIGIQYFDYVPPIQKTQEQVQPRPNLYITDYEAFYYTDSMAVSSEDSQQLNQRKTNSKSKSPSIKKWQLEKNVWIFKQNLPKNQQRFRVLNRLNTINFTKQDQYNFIQISDDNFQQYVSKQNQNKISAIMQRLQFQAQSTSDQNKVKQIGENKYQIRGRLIKYFILLENGGVFIAPRVVFLEGLSTWLQNIMTLPYINVGDKINSKINPQCFGFFQPDFGSIKAKLNVERQFEFQKKMILFPSLEEEFFACSKGSQYLRQLINAYIQLLEQKQLYGKLLKLNTNQLIIGKTEPNSIYKQGHLLANHIVLQSKQQELDSLSTGRFRQLAIDHFGLVTMNVYLSPKKLQHSFVWNRDKMYMYLQKLMIPELERHLGPLKFVFFFEDGVAQSFNRFVYEAKMDLNYIVEDSFLHKYFLAHLPKQILSIGSTQSEKQSEQIIFESVGFKKIEVQPMEFDPTKNLNNPQWLSFPKHVWTVWDSGIKRNSTVVVELCAQNLNKSSRNSGLQFHDLSSANLKSYISDTSIQKINYAIEHANFNINKQALSDIWRLAALVEHGGIYIDSTTFTIEENFDWVKNITRIPSNFLWNRHGQKPEVLLFWNPYFANDMNWKISKKQRTKSNWHLSYESSFIAAQKNSSLIKEWFQLYLQWITTPFEQIQKQMKYVGMWEQKWTYPWNRYLLVMDAIKFVVARRQKMISDNHDSQYQSSSDYYKIWSCPVQMLGLLKFRAQQNFQNIDYRLQWYDGAANFIYRYEYSLEYVESLKGEIIWQGKFFENGKRWNDKLLQFYRANKKNMTLKTWEQIIHPKSLLSVALLTRYSEKVFYLLSYYTKLIDMRLEFKSLSKLGY